MIFHRLTPVRAVRAISIGTLLVTLASAGAMRFIDGKEFPTIGRSLWWAAQTVTTVGYGDVVPHATAGRVLALVVMVSAIAFLTVITAVISAALIERERRRHASGGASLVDLKLQEIGGRIARLEEVLQDHRCFHALPAHVIRRPAPQHQTTDQPLGGHDGPRNPNP